MDDIVALLSKGARRRPLAATHRPYQDIDEMLLMAVDQGGDGMPVEIVEPAAHQGKSGRSEIDDRWRDVESAVEPGLYCVLIGRGHVGEMVRHQRADVASHDLLRHLVFARAA